MRGVGPGRDHGMVTTVAGTRAPAAPRVYRRPDIGLAGGVAIGIAEHVHVRPALIRVCFVALAAAGGLGIALYGAYWIVLPTRPGVRGRMPVWLEYLFGGIAASVAIAVVGWSLPAGGLVVPTTLACLGGALIWRQASAPERERLIGMSRDSLAAGGTGRPGLIRLVAGAALVAAGAALVLAKSDFFALRDGLLAMLVTIAGIALLSGPWWMRLAAQLSAERSERIRSQERADIAAHLHDSVLQTLALIQRNAASPREVARLARGQERELRDLLYGTRTASGQLDNELRRVAGEVEDAYAVAVDIVVVGDIAMTEDLAALVSAAREALVNAAKHSQTTSVSLYAEVERDAVHVFVKDRGVGFDPDDVADDRQGVRGSIVGRIERHGGTVEIVSKPGQGTEVRMTMKVGAP
jgi:signal transduction histidine kinase/phage shock protein PspC (stress-responsive transcriptional regulator)